MSSIKISLAVVGSLVAFVSSASAEIRYAGSPKFGQYAVSQAVEAGKSNPLDARAQLVAPQYPAAKGGIGARGL